jgi:ferredoxin/flavodoxin---NADP+ reductase
MYSDFVLGALCHSGCLVAVFSRNTFIVYTVYTIYIDVVQMLSQELINQIGIDELNLYQIIDKQQLSPQVEMIEVYAPEIARKARAGQFVILRVDEESERVPLTLVAWENKIGTITLVFQEVGLSTKKLGCLNVQDRILNLAGPLGQPSFIKNYGLAAVVCGGVGTAAGYPVAKALKEAGNKTVSIIGARNESLLILEEEMKKVSDELYVSTDDGSKGHKGFVSDVLSCLISRKYQFDIVYTIGPPLMMKAISEVTRQFGIKTIASLNPIMVDGMGMCGACRVTVNGLTKFACVDGPDFDAHETDFEELIRRLKVYSPEEKLVLDFHEKAPGGICKCRQC